ncbi:MAG: phosphoenolpyruvate synthase, partial [Alistipes sp.]|nr:phosphoenolpyruvate synthase [Alistipes sp.]
QCISDSTFTEGRKIITCSQILKYDTMPLSQILCDLLEIGEREMRCPVELEFAVNMDVPYGADKIFNFLQIRPIVDTQTNTSLNWDEVDTSEALVYAEQALGLGSIPEVYDLIYVRPEHFDTARTREIAEQIRTLNLQMRTEKRSYVLIGPGRWGSSDPWLGIPVTWSDISESKVIVESGLENFRVDPSQGTHFFQNLTSLGVGYMTLNPYLNDGKFDVEQLNRLPATFENDDLRMIHFDQPLYIYVDGRKNKGIIRQGS